MTNPIALIIGTRPEGIKMIPLYLACKKLQLPIVLISTSQHTQLSQEVYSIFNVTPDYELHIMRPGQDLFHISTEVLTKVGALFSKINPNLVLVQGATTTSMIAALAAFYKHIPIGHIEAGLSSENLKNPFPEEMNRRFISMVADFHFAPTQQAVQNLQSYGITSDAIYHTGNTVVDAIRLIKEKVAQKELTISKKLQEKIIYQKTNNKKIILLTIHRRELLDGKLKAILSAIKKFAEQNYNCTFFYPVHPNPTILEAVETIGLEKVHNVILCKPFPYQDMLYLLSHVDWVATDSGGVQEEAHCFGKHVLILRDTTERMEGLRAGLATLVGTKPDDIIHHLQQVTQQTFSYNKTFDLYGDGFAAEKIAQVLEATRKKVNFSIPSLQSEALP